MPSKKNKWQILIILMFILYTKIKVQESKKKISEPSTLNLNNVPMKKRISLFIITFLKQALNTDILNFFP